VKLFICPLPPPVHGQANVSQDTVDLFEDKVILDTNYTNMTLTKKVVYFFSYIVEFWYYILRYNIHVIYFTPSRSLLGVLRDIPVLLVGYFSPKKIIAHIHGGDFDSFVNGLNPVFRKLLIQLYSGCDYLVFPMKQIAENSRNTLGLLNTVTVPNYLERNTNYVADFNSAETIQLLFMSNILKTKGINEFMDLIAQVYKSNITFQAKIAGSFMKEAEQEKARVLKSQKKDLISYLGFISGNEKIEELSKCDFFILPSYSESFGIVLIEAMASGCIIITSNNKYHKYLIDNSFGRTFDFQNNIKGVVDFVESFKNNPKKMVEMKKAAVKEAKKYDFGSYKKQMVKLFNEN
jgi:glycosyltransferase involved in cell wall biosynthesis